MVLSYFCGCFNGAVIVSKYILHNDVRAHGSGNAGLTNFHRTFGGGLTFAVILCDVLKAVVAVLIGAWLMSGVDFVLLNGLMNGMSSKEFAPEGKLTRAQLVTILYRMAGSPSVEGLKNPFTDVPGGTWYTDAVIWAADKGVVTGTTATTFAPDVNITREQIATILFRYAGAEAVSENHLAGFKDADKISGYARDAMNWAVANGLINGMGDGTVAPNATATRAQIATILMRFAK